MIPSRGSGRITCAAIILSCLTLTLFISNIDTRRDIYDAAADHVSIYTNKWHLDAAVQPAVPISYDLTTPPSTGCEDVVSKLQLQLIEAYSQMLMGIRYVNLWGYLETENKGDAAIWVAQQILLATLGIETMQSCRFLTDCDLPAFNTSLTTHAPYSAILMAGGGNFNDHYWLDHPARLEMVQSFPHVPVRAFPQSVFMTDPDRIAQTQSALASHPDLVLAARDRPSHAWLDEHLTQPEGIPSVLVPDIAFMWGNRPDFRLNTPKAYDILILAREDAEISAGDSSAVPKGEGFLDLGGEIGNVSYLKVDWKFTHTPGIDGGLPFALWGADEKAPSPVGDLSYSSSSSSSFSDKEDNPSKYLTPAQHHAALSKMYAPFSPDAEPSPHARAWAKAVAGFQLLGSARFVITDRLHGHIMATLMGTPHVLMDSMLGKNLNFHDTWTAGCGCVRVARGWEEAVGVAGLFFGEGEGQWVR